MRTTLTLQLPPSLDALALIGERLRPHLESHYGPLAACYEVELAAVELFSNVARHNQATEPVELVCNCWARAVVLTLRDDGFAFDMSAHRPSGPPDPLQTSGRGIWLIHELCDRFSYRRTRECNLHTFIKRIAAPAANRGQRHRPPGNEPEADVQA